MCDSIARDVARQEEQVPTFLCLQGIPEFAAAAPAMWRPIVQFKMCRRSIMSAVFVISNRHGSSIIRGLGAVRITNGSLAFCDRIWESRVGAPSVVVHVKLPCRTAFGRWPIAHHVYDRIDQFNLDVRRYRFAAEILSDEAQYPGCHSRVCAVIPHHVNMGCRIHENFTPPPKPVVGVVGMGVAPIPIAIPNVTIMYERGHPCAFFDQIDIAVAWKKEGRFRPAERFTNPIAFGIPTIGSDYFPSFRHYVAAAPFLCRSDACIVERIHAILNGTLLAPFDALRSEVLQDVDPRNVQRLYESVFRLAARTGRRRALAPLI